MGRSRHPPSYSCGATTARSAPIGSCRDRATTATLIPAYLGRAIANPSSARRGGHREARPDGRTAVPLLVGAPPTAVAVRDCGERGRRRPGSGCSAQEGAGGGREGGPTLLGGVRLPVFTPS